METKMTTEDFAFYHDRFINTRLVFNLHTRLQALTAIELEVVKKYKFMSSDFRQFPHGSTEYLLFKAISQDAKQVKNDILIGKSALKGKG